MMLWRGRPPDQFVTFHHQEERIAALEAALLKQQMINSELLAYVEADMATTWMDSAKTLADALRVVLKE